MKTIIQSILRVGVALLIVAVEPKARGQVSNRIDTVGLAWMANTESDLGGYKLYFTKSTNEWTHVQLLGLVTNTMVTLPSEGTWFFALTATNRAGLESFPTKAVEYTTPSGPNKPSMLSLVSASVIQISSITTTTNLIYLP